jgi:hypothetical protein
VAAAVIVWGSSVVAAVRQQPTAEPESNDVGLIVGLVTVAIIATGALVLYLRHRRRP